jgi:hypothetical protein
LNNGKDKKPDYYTAFQFERLLYRPDLVERYFTDRGDWKDLEEEILREFSVSDIRKAAPPNIEFTQLASRGIGESTSSYPLNLKVNKRELPVKEYSVYVNGIPVLRYDERQLSAAEENGFSRSHNIPLASGLNEIRVEVMTEKSMGLKTTYIEGATGKVISAKDQKSDLYVLGIGVDTLVKSPYRSLRYAVADADAFIGNIRNEGLGEFDNVYVKLLSDTSEILPTRQNITEQLKFFRPSGPNDTVILYLAAHGMSNKAGDYFLLPRDTVEGDIDFLLENPDKAFDPKSMVKWDVFFNALREASGRRLLIVDSCQARRINGNFDAGSLIKRSSAASFALMAASKGAEVSIESTEFGHGIFTYAMLNGLSDHGVDENANGKIELSELFAHVAEFVDEFTESLEQVQTPQLYSPDFLLNMPLNQL